MVVEVRVAIERVHLPTRTHLHDPCVGNSRTPAPARLERWLQGQATSSSRIAPQLLTRGYFFNAARTTARTSRADPSAAKTLPVSSSVAIHSAPPTNRHGIPTKRGSRRTRSPSCFRATVQSYGRDEQQVLVRMALAGDFTQRGESRPGPRDYRSALQVPGRRGAPSCPLKDTNFYSCACSEGGLPAAGRLHPLPQPRGVPRKDAVEARPERNLGQLDAVA
jgi:hypothetical protein